jgi:hypothetical protein
VVGLEVAVGFLIAWFARKAGRAVKRLDGVGDALVDAGADRLYEVVTAKLGEDSALKQLAVEAAATGDAATRTQDRVRLALEDAAEQDPAFAADLKDAMAPLQAGVTIGRDVRADNGVAIVMTGGSVSFGERPDPSGPDGQSPRR